MVKSKKGKTKSKSPLSFAQRRNFVIFRLRGMEALLDEIADDDVVVKAEEKELRDLSLAVHFMVEKFANFRAYEAARANFFSE